MKNISKLLKTILITICIFVGIPNAFAASCKVGLAGNSTVNVGRNIDLTVNVTEISGFDGIASFQGELVYDNEYLEYVSHSKVISFGSMNYSKTNNMMVGYAGALEEWTKGTSANVMKFTFKAKKAGNTTVKIDKAEVGSATPKGTEIPSTSVPKTITIGTDSTNADLSSLAVTGYTITPTFNKNTTTYSLTVPNSVSSVTVTATAEDTNAKIAGTGNKNLTAGQNNPVKVTVTAQSGAKKEYTINITREKAPEVPKSSDNTLKGLEVDGFELSPAFNKNTTNYTITVPNGVNDIKVNATKNDTKAKVEIIGNTGLKEGENKVQVKVTAEDLSTKVYTITVNKEGKPEEPPAEKSSDATLKSLTVSSGTLSPAFDAKTNAYNLEVDSNVNTLNVKALTNDTKAKVEVTGNTNLKTGMNSVVVIVTAENGNKNLYVINVNKKAPASTPKPSEPAKKSDDSYLNNIIVAGTSLSPNFNKDISNYEVTVPYETDKLDISYIASSKKAKVEIIGNDNLLVGKVNPIYIKVTAEDGSMRYYTINALRSSNKSNNKLKTLTVKDHDLSPNFDGNTLNYSVTVGPKVDKLDLTAIAEDSESTVEIIGNKGFKIGNNRVEIKVTDKNGFARTYIIDVEKQEKAVMGMGIGGFLLWLFLILGLIGLFLLILFLWKKKKEKEETPTPPQPTTPIIDFKPEFNFGSRNGTDDDVVYHGNLTQDSTLNAPKDDKKLLEASDYIEDYESDDILDMVSDETVTKDEIISAIKEGLKTKNSDKLKMLLKQDEVNQLRKKIKKEENNKRSNRFDD